MWLYVPSLSSPDAEAWTSPSDSQLDLIARSATWRTKSLRPASWRRVLRTEASLRLLSGLISDPSTAQHGVGRWISSLVDSPARTFPSLASKPESQREPEAASGLSTCESFARFNPDGSLSKMFRQFSLIPREESYSEGLPAWGSMRNGELFERPMLAPRTSGNASSCWPTARSEDAECAGNHPGATDSLTGATRDWRTPNTRDHHAQGPRSNHPQRQTTLVDQVQRQTPASDSFRSRGGDRKDEMGLDQQARMMWHTPSTEDDKTDGPKVLARYGTPEMLTTDQRLRNQAAHFPTPAQRDYRSPNAKPYSERGGETKGEQLANFICHSSLQAQPTETLGENSSPNTPGSRLRLNPAFVCMLMAWPWWWTHPEPISFAREAMASWRSRARRCLWNWLAGQGLRANSGSGGGMSWATPNTPTGGPNCVSTPRHTGGLDLDGQVQLWTTPQSHDERGGYPHRANRGTNRGGCANLADEVTAW